MNKLTTGLAVFSLCGLPLLAAIPSDSPRTLGPVVLKELAIQGGKVTLRVDSGGCTDKSAIRASVQKEKGLTDRVPNYAVTFERVRVDDCKALMFEGVVLEYDIARDLKITGLYTLSVTNWVSPRSEDSVAEEMSLNGALIQATARAIEMELKGYDAKVKLAEGGVGPAGNAERFKKRIAELNAELARYKGMAPADYSAAAPQEDPLAALEGQQKYGPIEPASKKTVTVTVKEPYKEGSTLDLEGMTRSGPFYHLAGIAGNDYTRLKPGTKHELTVYLVYKREYFGAISDCYAYIAEIK